MLTAKLRKRSCDVADGAGARKSSADSPDFRVRTTKQRFRHIEVVSDAARDFITENLAPTHANVCEQGFLATEWIANDLVSEFQKRGYVTKFD